MAATHGDGDIIPGVNAPSVVLTDKGLGALWVGFAAMSLCTVYFLRASYHSHSKTSRIYHYLTTLITAFAAFAYLLMAVGQQSYNPFGYGFNLMWVHYADWSIGTPMLLIDLGMLAGMGKPEVVFLCFMDVIMIGTGYAALVSTDHRATWPIFTFGVCCYFVIVASLLAHLHAISQAHIGSPESRAFRFLAVWTIGLWTTYPLLFILSKLHVMDYDADAIVYCVLDVLAKGVFGAILVGSREALEGEWTPLAMMAMAMTGINPTQRRRSSMDMTYVQEIRAHLAETEGMPASVPSAASPTTMNPMHGGVALAPRRASFKGPDGRSARGSFDVSRDDEEAVVVGTARGSPGVPEEDSTIVYRRDFGSPAPRRDGAAVRAASGPVAGPAPSFAPVATFAPAPAPAPMAPPPPADVGAALLAALAANPAFAAQLSAMAAVSGGGGGGPSPASPSGGGGAGGSGSGGISTHAGSMLGSTLPAASMRSTLGASMGGSLPGTPLGPGSRRNSGAAGGLMAAVYGGALARDPS